MSAGILAALKVVLGLDTGPFQRGATQAQLEARKMVRSIESTGKKMVTIGAGISAGITAPFVALVSSAIPAARESAEAMAQVNASLTSMGPVAQRTAAQLQEQAAALMHISTFDDDEILRSVTANMLTFGNVAGPAFDRAQLAAVNLATKLKTDLQSATLLVGKAVNDPVKGLAALGRAGIQFTADQKATIKSLVETGQAAKAQDVILKELEKQFGGSAAAMRAATPGADIKNSWDDLKEKIGKIALDILPKILPPLNNLLDAFNKLSPSTQATVVGVAAVAAAIGPLLIGVGGLVTTFATLGPPLIAAGTAFVTFSAGILTAAIPAIGSLIVALAPILIPLAAVAAAVGAVYFAWKHWDEIEPILRKAWEAVKAFVVAGIGKALDLAKSAVTLFLRVHREAFEFIAGAAQRLYLAVKTWLQDKLGAVFQSILHPIETVKKAFFGMYDAVVGHSYVPDMVDGIADQFGRLDGVMVKVAEGATDKTSEAFRTLRDGTQNLLDGLFPDQAQVRSLQEKYKTLDQALAAKLIDPQAYAAARDRLRGEMDKLADQASASMFGEGANQSLISPEAQERLTRQMEDFATETDRGIGEPVRRITEQVAEDFTQMAQDVIGSLDQTVRAIKKGDFLGALQGVLDVVGKVIGAINGAKGGSGSGGGIGGAFSAAVSIIGSFGGARALGGPVSAGTAYLVGERGPELFSPGRSGTIIPNNALSRGPSGGGNTFNFSGNLLTPEFWAQINDGHAEAARKGASGGAQMALGALGRAQGRRLA